MDILYLRGMEKHCRDRQGAVKKWGADQGRQVMRRILSQPMTLYRVTKLVVLL